MRHFCTIDQFVPHALLSRSLVFLNSNRDPLSWKIVPEAGLCCLKTAGSSHRHVAHSVTREPV